MVSNSARTERCTASIKSRSGTKAKVIILTGRLHAGKSSLAELLTGVTGLSSNRIRSETDACQIIDTRIDSTEYFIVDTPGFEDQNKWQVFCKILNIVKDLRNHAIFGVWYLFDNTRRGEQLDQTLLSWLSAFCGDAFCPSLTIITTFWRGEGAELRQWNERLDDRLRGDWAELLGHGAQYHAFGKVHVDGTAQDETIPWYDATRREELISQAQEMASRYCHGMAEPVPLVLQELYEGWPLRYTSAARVLRPIDQDDQNPQGNRDASNATGRESNRQPEGERAAPQSTFAWLGGQVFNLAREVVQGVVQGVTQGGVHYHAGGGGAGVGRQAGNGGARRTFGDPLSSRDTAISYGRPGDYNAREGYYNSFNLDRTLGKFTGSATQGDALRQKMDENW